MAKKRGYVPENLIIYSRAPDTWHLDAMHEGGTYQHRDHRETHTVKGRKGFAVDKEKDKGERGTAGRWANAKPLTARSRVAMLFEDVDEAWEERPNKPLKNLRVFHLEQRAEGGRAYKVLDEDGYVWDMREDVFVEACIECGIKKGGIIGGQYVWAVNHTQMRLVRVGSQLHKDLSDAGKRRKQKKLGVKDLVPGKVYANAAGELAYFAGFVKVDKKKHQLWFKPRNAADPDELAREIPSTDNHFRWEVVQSSSYVECRGDLPGRWTFDLDAVRTIGQNALRHYHRDYSSNRYRSYRGFSGYLGSQNLIKLAQVQPVTGTPTPIPDDIQRIVA